MDQKQRITVDDETRASQQGTIHQHHTQVASQLTQDLAHQMGLPTGNSTEGQNPSPTDFNSRLPPSYNWQGQPGAYPDQHQQHLFPVQTFNGTVDSEMQQPAQPPHQAAPVRADQVASADPRGPYSQRLEMAYPGQQQTRSGWATGGSLSPATAKEERASESSRPGTAEGAASDLAVKQEAAEVSEEPAKLDHRKRKRNRTIRSCVPCHNHKRKCDRRRPCGRCTALGLTGSCVYEVDQARDLNDPEVIETDRLRRRIAELEQVVRELRQKHPLRAGAAQAATGQPTADDKRRVIVDRFTKFKLGDAATGGLASMPSEEGSPESGTSNRSIYAEPYNAASLPGEDMVSDNAGQKTFLGAPAGKPIFRRLREVMGKGKESLPSEHLPEDLAYTGWFASRSKTFPFTTIWSHDNFLDEILGLLPTAEDAELLLEAFTEEIAVIFEAWSPPQLEAGFRHFFTLTLAEQRTQPLQELALWIMICSLGSMIRSSISEIFGDSDSAGTQARASDDKDHTSSRLQSELYLSAAYQALRLCSFLSSPTLETIQTQILINIYLIHSERAADSWALTGSLVRQCIAMGLHVDPTHLDPRISMKDAEIRRRIWWTVAGFDCLLCVSFGRPSVITYYTCAIPQDWPDDQLSDEAGSAVLLARDSNKLGPETNDETYHAAYYQLSLPSLELLNRVFHVNPVVARDTFMGWFTPSHPQQEPQVQLPTVVGNMYEDAIRLGRDIFDWYAHLPEGMRFDPDDRDLGRLSKRTRRRINQTLALTLKTFILVLILHRPYLRADPTAYPESSQLCGQAAHVILTAYAAMARTKSSIVWSWWTMSYRAFHAGTVCAFLAIREPRTPLAERCLSDLRSAITIFENRSSSWSISHPVQSDLCSGLHRLENLAHVAVQQHSPHTLDNPHNSANIPVFPHFSVDPSVPTMPSDFASVGHSHAQDAMNQMLNEVRNGHGQATSPPGTDERPRPFLQPWSLTQPDSGMTSPFTTEPLALPQIWASMFNIKLDPEQFHTGASQIPGLIPSPDQPQQQSESGAAQ